jgi:hypothetical protein
MNDQGGSLNECFPFYKVKRRSWQLIDERDNEVDEP